MSKISVIVPVYNSAAFLNRCFHSLTAMVFTDFEVIAVDDGSEDDSWSIIEDFARRDPRFSKSFRAPHCGAGPARNAGLEIATGDYIAFVDPDDHVDPDYCGAPYALACEQGADLVLFGSWWVYSDRTEIHLPTCKPGMNPQEALLSTTPMIWEKLYRRAFLQQRELNFPAIQHEDEVFTPLLMSHAPRIAVLERPLYVYVKREDSSTGLRVNPNSVDVLQAFQLVVAQGLARPPFRHELEYYAVRFLRWTSSCWKTSQEPWAIECLSKAERLLGTIDRPGSDSPYLVRERRSRSVFSRLGRHLRRGVAHCLKSISGVESRSEPSTPS